jgi:diguanylate cyclase (GGDEF)-like protein
MMETIGPSAPPPSWLSRFDRALRAGSRAGLGILIGLLVGVVGYLDYATGVDISFSIFYLVPVSLAAWYLGNFPGLMTAVVSAAVWMAMEMLGGHVTHPPWAPYWNAAVRFGFFLITVLLLHRLRETLERETRMARSDVLTGVLNGRAFEESARSWMAMAEREGKPLTVAYIDVDDFKRVNDVHGHAEGDRLLRSVAGLLRNSIRQSDLVARLGGDEFALLLYDSNASRARAVLERILENRRMLDRGPSFPVTLSIGAVTFLRPPSSVDEAVHAADVLMYDVKNGGKNAFRLETAS